MAEDRPYTIDDTNLITYYNKLNVDTVEHDIELMKSASIRELYELIATNCQHYIALIENYKSENLQTLFNMSIKRIDGHLVIKFRLNTSDRWVEVGFFDDDNTDAETLSHLKTMIIHHLGSSKRDPREHVTVQLDESCEQKVHVSKKKVEDDHLFDTNQNPELKVNERQLESAGYKQIPTELRVVEEQLKKPSAQVFNVSEFAKQPAKEEPTNTSNDSHLSNITDEIKQFKSNLKKQLGEKGPKSSLESIGYSNDEEPSNLMNQMRNHMRLRQWLEKIADSVGSTHPSMQAYLYQYTADILGQQDPLVVASVVIELIRNQRVEQQLTKNQKEIIRKYDIDLMDL